MRIFLFVLFNMLLCAVTFNVVAQESGVITGKVIDARSRETIPFANLIIERNAVGTSTNIDGEFELINVPLGYNNIITSVIGYERNRSQDLLVTNGISPYVVIELIPKVTELDEVVIQNDLIEVDRITPLSKQVIGVAEIEKSPGGNRDISKVIQTLPGVASPPGFRNDILVRGGSPSENQFFIDGIEIPVINHFQTQGASGGPVGMINTDLIQEAELLTGAFPASRGNALSSSLELKMKTGLRDHVKTRVTLGSSDAGVTIDGPISSNTQFILSARQSYLQFLFDALDLPFLPTYNDVQFKVSSQMSEKTFLTIVGLGALDQFELNEDVVENITDEVDLKQAQFILDNIPVQEQWNYTVGAKLQRYVTKGSHTFIISRNAWNNTAEKYADNDSSIPENLRTDYASRETESKFRWEYEHNYNRVILTTGVELQASDYTTSTFSRRVNSNGVYIVDYDTDLSFRNYATYGQLSSDINKRGWNVSVGLRMDGADYSKQTNNPLDQLSPRINTSYPITDRLNANASAGLYYQLPPYTVLGFRNNENILVNRNNKIRYIGSNQVAGGLSYFPSNEIKVSVEGFFKDYSRYPFSTVDSISLANLGSDFGVIGNDSYAPTSEGRAYGFELFLQKRSTSGIYGLASYTYVHSEFKNELDQFISSSWDSRHLISIAGGLKMSNNWDVGGKWRFVGGQPFTPYDMEASALKENWDASPTGILDYRQLNSLRKDDYHQLDIRVDKTWYWRSASLNLYLDLQNVYNQQLEDQPILLVQRDENGNNITNPNDENRYLLESIENTSGNLLPSIGVIVDF